MQLILAFLMLCVGVFGAPLNSDPIGYEDLVLVLKPVDDNFLRDAADIVHDQDGNFFVNYQDDEHKSRSKRQVYQAADIALRHNIRDSNRLQPVGTIHGQVDAIGVGDDRSDYHLDTGVGLGTVLWKSGNERHSLGLGVYSTQSIGKYDGSRYESPRNYGYGLGYQYGF